MCSRTSSVIVVLCVVYGQCQSPCPGVFEYKSDGTGIYGVINVQPTGYVPTLQLQANFTIAARLPSNYVGRIEPVVNSPTLLQDYNRGVPLQYRVDFPVTSPLPRPTAIIVNENVLCYGPGDLPGPHQYVTMTSLQHTLFLKDGSGSGFFQYQPHTPGHSKPQLPDLETFLQQPDGDTQIFTFEEGNRHGSWNSISHPNRTPEYERPAATRPPQTRPPPPDPQYYPEVVTSVVTEPPPPPPPAPVTRPVVQTPPPAPATKPSSPSIECGVISGGNERQPLIYNGQTYARGDWPWLVAIYKRKDGSLSFICSGTLVSERHVVTAAHCMQQKNTFSSKKDIVVKVGVYNLEDWGDDITVTRTLATASIHESYNATSLANDILVLTFERSVEFSVNIRPACLWSGSPDLSRVVGASGVVAGWGQSETGQAGRGEPRMVRVPIVSTSSCRASNADFHKLTSDNTICAGDRNGAGPCLGDSGGGLYLLEGGRWRLRGVVSLSLRPKSGDNSCNLNEYIVFTDSAKYLSWIQSVMYST